MRRKLSWFGSVVIRALNEDYEFPVIFQPTCQRQLVERQRMRFRSARRDLREWIAFPQPRIAADLEAGRNLFVGLNNCRQSRKHRKMKKDGLE